MLTVQCPGHERRGAETVGNQLSLIPIPHPLTHEFTLNRIPFKNKLKAIKLTEQKIIESMADKGAGCGCDS